ncbi:GntR family transcriptional regulator [Streptomyces violarus]|uniref:GntR family transcriptional repressor for pyruvate dehydrogenase complex n=1 Tax=Streptomyces violarus TaxID=67380 RepID=A0A7W4ZJQ9_9ACTN|nr:MULTISPECIES: FadR/GntR family transcriptional regulator [Streptomyces]MBB3073745.1 GntR family transcriptional repressor for pyruvate dehydrogenase complex [Streptomyces violarus]WRT96495.1 FadR/GntR family transcriptional regulator [Streptomyces sp. CGMCC 4.1772]GHC96207.1 GntR family transcriptional regulator [Streptomyces violarus]
MFSKVSGPVRLADQVAATLSEEIESGRLAEGDRLPTEVELVRQLGVSRTVVREALSRLRNAGLIEPRQGIGVFVLPRRTRPLDLEAADTKAKVLQIVEVRRAMEGEAAHLAAARATPLDLARMRQALEAIDSAVGAGGDGVDEDLAFHRSIAESTGNTVMVSTLRYLGDVSRSGIRVTRANEARRNDFIEAVRAEHHAILAAIEARDAEAARMAARLHMNHAAARLQNADDRFWTDAEDIEVDLDAAP